MNKAETLEKLKKLKTMAERGTPGEAANAEKMIKIFLKKFNFHESDLEDKPERRFFRCPTKYETRLLFQVISKVLNSNEGVNYGKYKREYSVSLTQAQYIEVDRLYNIYRREWKKTIKKAYSAFVHANNIFKESGGDDNDKQDLTPEEIKEMEEIMEMMSTMDKIEIYKEIES